MNNHWYNEGKQILIKKDKMGNKEKTHRQWRSNQGRSPESMEAKYKGCGLTVILFLITVIGALIYNMI